MKESLELSQEAYHLQTLAERQSVGPNAVVSDTPQRVLPPTALAIGGPRPDSTVLSAPRTKFAVTTYTREVATAPVTSRFSELEEHNVKQVDAALAAKYRLHHKVRPRERDSVCHPRSRAACVLPPPMQDYTKYLHKQTPTSVTLVKRSFHL